MYILQSSNNRVVFTGFSLSFCFFYSRLSVLGVLKEYVLRVQIKQLSLSTERGQELSGHMSKRTQTENKISAQGRDCDSDVPVRSSFGCSSLYRHWFMVQFPQICHFFPEIRVKFSVFEIHEHLLPVEKENNNFKIFLMGAFRDI